MPLPKAAKQQGPRSLQRMCITVAIRSIASIRDLGEIPLNVAKPLLRHIENPMQLHEIEMRSPQLANKEDMAEIWTRLLNKKFPNWEKDRHKFFLDEEEDAFEDMSWFEIYSAIKDATDRANAAATAELQQKLAGFDKAKQAGHAALMVNSQALLKKMPGQGVRRRGQGGPTNAFTFGGGQRTKMTTGQSVLRRVRREAKEISNVSHLSTPTGNLRVDRGQIRKAPEAMVNDYRVAHNPETTIRAPRKRIVSVGHGIAGTTEKEERLLALKAGSSAATASGSASMAATAPRPASSKAIIAPRKRRLGENNETESPRPAKKFHSQHHAGYKDLMNNWDDSDNADDMDDLFGDIPEEGPGLTAEDLERSFEESSISTTKSATPKKSSAGGGSGSSRPASGAVSQSMPHTARRPTRPYREDDDDPSPRRRAPPEQENKPAQRPLKPPAQLNPLRTKSSPAKAPVVDGVDTVSPSRRPVRRSPPPSGPMLIRKKKPAVFMQPKKR